MTASYRQLEPWECEPFAEASPAIAEMRRRCADCPSARLLSAAAAEALPADEQEAVAAHVASCPTCRDLQADFERLDPVPLEVSAVEKMLRQVARQAKAESRPSPRRWTYWVPVSAAVAAGFLLLVFAGRALGPAPAPVSPTPVPNLAVAAPVPTPPPVVAPGPALEKPPVKLTMLALTWRSGEGTIDFAADIAPALDAFRADRYDEAARKLQALAPRYPSSVEIPFYRGVSQLFLGSDNDAVNSLRRAQRLADDTFASDAAWYLGIALARSGHVIEARVRFESLCRGGTSPYAERACAAAK